MRRMSIRSMTVAVVVTGMGLLAVIALGFGWIGARASMVDTAGRLAQHMGLVLQERVARTLEPAERTLRTMSRSPLTQAQSLAQRLLQLPVLLEELAANPHVTSVYVGYRNGEFFLVRALDNPNIRRQYQAPRRANFLVQSRALSTSGQLEGSYLFYDADGRLIKTESHPRYQFDPRTRDWFVHADGTAASVFTGPYVFFSSRQVGVTLSLVSQDGAAVVGVDWALEDLSAALSELRGSRDMRLALLNSDDQVLAHSTLDVLQIQPRDRVAFLSITALPDAGLLRLLALGPTTERPVLMPAMADQPEQIGFVLPFQIWPDQTLRMLVTMPLDEVLGDLPQKYLRLLGWSLLVMALTLAGGWWMGSHLGERFERLANVAHHIGLFNFSDSRPQPTYFKEFNRLNSVVTEMGLTIQRFLTLSRDMAAEPEVNRMLDKVLQQMVLATRSESGAVYLQTDEGWLNLRAADYGEADRCVALDAVFPPQLASGQMAFAKERLASHGLQTFDLELRARNGELQGLLVLVHADDQDHADPAFIQFARQLSGMLAVSIETRQLNDALQTLLDAVVRLMADAIDAKSPYTGGHCERVPVLATMLVDRMAADTEGPFAQFQPTPDQQYAFKLGAWMHDCGKVTSPEHIVDKATKLEVIQNRIHEIRTRFEVLWRDATIEHLERVLDGQDAAASQTLMMRRQRQLREDFAFVAHCNLGSENMDQESIGRLQTIGAQTWLRHFDNQLGLAQSEAQRLNEAMREDPDRAQLPAQEPLLCDRPEHVVPWGDRKPPVERDDPANRYGFDMVLPPHKQNMGELYNLSVRRGTLTPEDRFQINDHIVQTYIMLRELPWPQRLQIVPEIAATHHERMDGEGYPRKLPGERLTVFDKVMAVADIFEALTAADRPYKMPKKLSESLRIMGNMCRNGHIDTDVFRYFLHSGLWAEFAERFMQAEQIDPVDVQMIEDLLPHKVAAAPMPLPASGG